MVRRNLFLVFILLPSLLFSQEKSLEKLIFMPGMKNASLSVKIIEAGGKPVIEYNSGKSLTPASILKLVTSAAALEMLGPDYTFKTLVGYSGKLERQTGKLSGNIIIKGGGDPSLGSPNFSDHYGDFIGKWTSEIKKAGIKSIEGRIISDDSWYDYLPVPAKWLWEDAGNYYGAGAYGLSVFDNTYEIHFRTGSDSSKPVITATMPEECRIDLTNMLTASGTTDEGYVFSAPYGKTGWIAGTIPVNKNDFVLKASINDPPLAVARMIDRKLKNEGIRISAAPSTFRIQPEPLTEKIKILSRTISPPLKEIIRLLNHKSINLYAEHLTKELGRVFKGSPSTSSGIDVLKEFLLSNGVTTDGISIDDGSGLSPLDAISSENMVSLLLSMKKNGKYFPVYLASFPDAGKEGTMRYYFRDPVFDSRLKVKGGTMKGVRSFAGYMTTMSGKELIFCIIVNHFSGPSLEITASIEEILKEAILSK